MMNGEVRMDGQDRRVKRTQRLLARALIALTLEKGYEAVTIRDITERADVGYATFFRHYRDKDALLREVSEVVLAELTAHFPGSPDADAVTVGTTLFRYVQEHQNIIRVLLSIHGPHSPLQHIVALTTQELLQMYAPKEDSIVPIEVAINHLIQSSIALIRWWLEHDLPYPPEHMGHIYDQLIDRPTRALAFGSLKHE